MSDKKPKESENHSPAKGKKGTVAKGDNENVVDDTDDLQNSIRTFFQKLHLVSNIDKPITKVLEDLTLDGLIKLWKKNSFKNVVTMVGAGISTSAGIPDFRSPGSGLYDNLQKYNLPHPSSIFEMDYFEENPQPFFALAKELYPGTFNPTLAHYFVRLLHEKGLLQRHYTQNIDTLERIAGIPDEKLVEAHGTFYTNHCLKCHKLYSMEWMKEQIFSDCVPTCSKCEGIVKPDIVFFGENLPEKFYNLPAVDFDKCDLLIIMGTSLEVQPFASLVDRVGPQCVRLLINRTKVGHDSDSLKSWFTSGPGLLFDSDKNTRDIAFIGDCDDGAMKLAEGLGWAEELKDLMKCNDFHSEKKKEEYLEDELKNVATSYSRTVKKAIPSKKNTDKAHEDNLKGKLKEF